MPFWVCNTESFSGAKKRESKSEAFNTVCADFGAGKYTSAEEALQAFNDAKSTIGQ